MTALPKQRMTVDDFLSWVEKQPKCPRYELIDGLPIAMAAERVRHARVKAQIYLALRQAVAKVGEDCEAFMDGMAIKIDKHTTYEPDAQVYCGERMDGDAMLVPSPIIIVEVLSSGTKYIDAGKKLSGYFQLVSVRHYLMVDPVKKLVIHHERGKDGIITTHIVQNGKITMSPPGIEVELAEIFGIN